MYFLSLPQLENQGWHLSYDLMLKTVSSMCRVFHKWTNEKKKGIFIFKCLKPLGLALLASLNNSPDIPPGILGPYSLFCQNIFSKEEIKLHFAKTINELKQLKDNIIHNKYRFLFLKSITFQIENVKEKKT